MRNSLRKNPSQHIYLYIYIYIAVLVRFTPGSRSGDPNCPESPTDIGLSSRVRFFYRPPLLIIRFNKVGTSPSCKYSNVQSFFGVKPYCDLGAIGAKGENWGMGVNWIGHGQEEEGRVEGGGGGVISTLYELSSASRAFCLKRRKKTSLYL